MTQTRLLGLLAVVSIVVIVAACLLGSTSLALRDVLAALIFAGSPGDQVVVWQISSGFPEGSSKKAA